MRLTSHSQERVRVTAIGDRVDSRAFELWWGACARLRRCQNILRVLQSSQLLRCLLHDAVHVHCTCMSDGLEILRDGWVPCAKNVMRFDDNRENRENFLTVEISYSGTVKMVRMLYVDV